jgi:hypothetical protein
VIDGGNIWTVRFAECRWVHLVSEKQYMPANDALLRVVGIFCALTSTAPRGVDRRESEPPEAVGDDSLAG